MNTEERLSIIEEKLNKILAYYEMENHPDKMVLFRALELYDKNRVMVLNTGSNGINVGSSSGKVGLYGVTPVARAAGISNPTAAGDTYSQSQVDSIVNAVTSIITAIRNIGITS